MEKSRDLEKIQDFKKEDEKEREISRSIRQERINTLFDIVQRMIPTEITLYGSPATRITVWERFGGEVDRASNNPDFLEIYFENGCKWAIWDHQQLASFFDEYQIVLGNIEGVQHRRLDPDRRLKLIQNLEHRRKNIHDRAAETFIREFQKLKLNFDFKNARLFVEALHQFWLLDTLLQKQFFDEDFALLDINALKKEIKQRFDLKLNESKYRGGYHDEEPYYYYEISLSGPDVNVKKSEVLKYIREKIQKQKDGQ